MAMGCVGGAVGLGVTTGRGLTAMGTEGGGREGGTGAGRDSVRGSSALETLLMWGVGVQLPSG